MGSLSNADSTLPDAVVPKREPSIERYSSSSASTPGQAEATTATGSEQPAQEPAPAPKRKGGRKPIYATSEERKQRNRQAQAAFRERRTEYIKQLETTIQHHEETLQNLQQSHRAAADECLMLRYKNSLLERILLEKGIDVQAELALKGSPNLRPHRPPPMTGQASPMQKAMLNRQQQARHRPAMAPPIQTPTPPSQHSSPSNARSPGFALQGGMASPATDISEQEYDAQADMMDEMDGDDVDTDSFIPNFRLPPTTSAPGMPIGMQASPPMTTSAASDGGGSGVLIDPYDPMLDADPFGLTASMTFPNPYSYPPQQPRR
ncbi:hypothetical protein ABEF91_001207 [Exophiala dermatitidis]